MSTLNRDPLRWYRVAGARRFHASHDYGFTSLCGASVRNAYVYRETTPTRTYSRLCDYPNRWGYTDACAKCKRVASLNANATTSEGSK
jgi:hypothetical protein